MDVFIPEEYVTRRRVEKREATKKRSEPTVSDSGIRRAEREEKNHQKPHNFQFHENEHLFYTTTGLTENIVYSCLSA